MISMPTNICPECFEKLTAAIESGAVTAGSVNVFCRHNSVLLTGEMMAGLLVDWMLLPCASQEQGYNLVEAIRREWVEKLTEIADTPLASSEKRH